MNKKIIITVIIVIFLAASITAVYFLFLKKPDTENGSGNKKAELYICPMHPQIQQDHPGVCPICNMELILKNQGDDSGHNHGMGDSMSIGELTLSPAEQVLANVRTEKAAFSTFDFTLEANGVVKARDDATRQISSPVKGKLTRMYVNYEGQWIRKGQKAFEIYSPEMIATQKEYLLALENYRRNENSQYAGIKESASSMLDAARQRLKLWFLDDSQIEELTNTGKIKSSLVYYADYGGVVTKKYYNEGSWVMEGTTLADVINLSSVWVMANIYEYEIEKIRTGQSVDIMLSGYGDNIIKGRIDYINPFVNPDTRTIEVRITVPNRGMKLKPEMYVKIKIQTGSSSSFIVLPRTAVLRTGMRDVVYVRKDGNVFSPREVVVGGEKDGKYLIRSGIQEGDEVVVSAGFLIDSETQIRYGTATTHQHGEDNGDMTGMKTDEGLKINQEQDALKDMKMQTETASIRIPTSQCEMCKDNIESALKRVGGVISANADIDTKVVTVKYDKSKTNLRKLETAITNAGYDANNRKRNMTAYEKLDKCCKLPEDRNKPKQKETEN